MCLGGRDFTEFTQGNAQNYSNAMKRVLTSLSSTTEAASAELPPTTTTAVSPSTVDATPAPAPPPAPVPLPLPLRSPPPLDHPPPHRPSGRVPTLPCTWGPHCVRASLSAPLKPNAAHSPAGLSPLPGALWLRSPDPGSTQGAAEAARNMTASPLPTHTIGASSLKSLGARIPPIVGAPRECPPPFRNLKLGHEWAGRQYDRLSYAGIVCIMRSDRLVPVPSGFTGGGA